MSAKDGVHKSRVQFASSPVYKDSWMLMLQQGWENNKMSDRGCL